MLLKMEGLTWNQFRAQARYLSESTQAVIESVLLEQSLIVLGMALEELS
jgi:hypothetical protein